MKRVEHSKKEKKIIQMQKILNFLLFLPPFKWKHNLILIVIRLNYRNDWKWFEFFFSNRKHCEFLFIVPIIVNAMSVKRFQLKKKCFFFSLYRNDVRLHLSSNFTKDFYHKSFFSSVWLTLNCPIKIKIFASMKSVQQLKFIHSTGS